MIFNRLEERFGLRLVCITAPRRIRLTGHGVGHVLLLIVSGPVTAVPLMLYGAAARRVPLSTIGVLMYLNPILQFLWGVLVVGEAMPATRWIGFVLVWVALAVFTFKNIIANRQQSNIIDLESGLFEHFTTRGVFKALGEFDVAARSGVKAFTMRTAAASQEHKPAAHHESLPGRWRSPGPTPIE